MRRSSTKDIGSVSQLGFLWGSDRCCAGALDGRPGRGRLMTRVQFPSHTLLYLTCGVLPHPSAMSLKPWATFLALWLVSTVDAKATGRNTSHYGTSSYQLSVCLVVLSWPFILTEANSLSTVLLPQEVFLPYITAMPPDALSSDREMSSLLQLYASCVYMWSIRRMRSV
jgi:hypothetical protein